MITITTTLTAEDIDALEPTYLGPTWARNSKGGFKAPRKDRTLGWEIAGWCHEFLQGKDGKPWQFTREQFRFILWWYAFDENGEFVYRYGVLQRLKGWG